MDPIEPCAALCRVSLGRLYACRRDLLPRRPATSLLAGRCVDPRSREEHTTGENAIGGHVECGAKWRVSPGLNAKANELVVNAGGSSPRFPGSSTRPNRQSRAASRRLRWEQGHKDGVILLMALLLGSGPGTPHAGSATGRIEGGRRPTSTSRAYGATSTG